MANVLIFGTGGVGSVYGYILHKAGCNVTAVCRTNYDAVKANGITIRSDKWGLLHYKPTAVRSTADASSRGAFEYVLVCSKAFPGTSKLIADVVTESTVVVLAQNGIGIEDEYAQLYPENTIISGIVYIPVTQTSPGVVTHTPALERLEIGTFPASASAKAKDQCQRLSTLWTAGDAHAPVFNDIQAQRWIKVAVNACFNPMTALAMCGVANLISSSPQALDLLKDVMREIGRAAAAAGYPSITEQMIEQHLARHTARVEPGSKEPSMLTDIRHNRPIEVEAILGNTFRIAQNLNVETPYLRMLYILAKARNHAITQADT